MGVDTVFYLLGGPMPELIAECFRLGIKLKVRLKSRLKARRETTSQKRNDSPESLIQISALQVTLIYLSSFIDICIA